MKENIIKWIKEYAKDSNIKSLVIGISGGIDSALTSTLCAETGIKTLIVSMAYPPRPNSTNQSS